MIFIPITTILLVFCLTGTETLCSENDDDGNVTRIWPQVVLPFGRL